MRNSSKDKDLCQTLQFIKFELLWMSSFYTISSVAIDHICSWQAGECGDAGVYEWVLW